MSRARVRSRFASGPSAPMGGRESNVVIRIFSSVSVDCCARRNWKDRLNILNECLENNVGVDCDLRCELTLLHVALCLMWMWVPRFCCALTRHERDRIDQLQRSCKCSQETTHAIVFLTRRNTFRYEEGEQLWGRLWLKCLSKAKYRQYSFSWSALWLPA